MILEQIYEESTHRLNEVRLLLIMIKSLENDKHPLVSNHAVQLSKGLFFVHLYGAYEHTINTTLDQACRHISSSSCPVREIKPRILSIILDDKFKPLLNPATKKDMWKIKGDLMERSISTEHANLSETIIPTDGKNFRYEQLDSIWKTFCLSTEVLPRMLLRNTIEEIVNNRNAIAHGNESPILIGSRNTTSDLENKLNHMIEVCTHIVMSFEDYLLFQQFRR
ncbi:MAG: MAE_28990/MAE_18760 family HEPN-like nuclease [Capsulimonas sp.]|uniref:MAE_28990/MAE_18760 family HEPN-like nuclease n=1 Tax=Capsulimonas sp. TaxID=2494211 RepID=UPI00326654A9